MKKFTTKNKLGFSLLELMVVVAIIGVLATFAVPRFNIFRARARQGEAKSNLGVIFTLQEAFKIDKERYYNGVGGANGWGGNAMNAFSDRDGYHNNSATATGFTDGARCRSNKLGFRLANCTAARYGYWIVEGETDEQNFLVYAYAPSDDKKRIFPGCDGSTTGGGDVNRPDQSTTGQKECTHNDGTSYATATRTVSGIPNNGGDIFCLDQNRTVDNFRDIVGDADCVD